jgi:hypothetical protein
MYKLKSRWQWLVGVALCTQLGCGKDDESPQGDDPETNRFSFFVTSLKAMQQLSGSEDGFGGDLRFGESGVGAAPTRFARRSPSKACPATARPGARS